MNEHDTRTRASAAKVALTEHNGAARDLHDGLMKRWLNTDITQTAEREAIWHQVKGLADVLAALHVRASAATVLDAAEERRDILNPRQGASV